MKRLIVMLLFVPLLAMAAGSDMVMTQRNVADTAQLTRIVAHPAGSADGIMGYVGATQLPAYYTAGPGLTIAGGVVDVVPTAWTAITGKPSTFPPSAHNQEWSTITGTPTTIVGYGLTDAASLTQLATKFNTPAGTTVQYVRGDGSLATLPIGKRIETFAGTTNASGQIIVSYSPAYPSVPNVQPGPPALASQIWTVASSTASGFTLQLNQRNVVTLLGIEVLLGATVPVVGAAAQVLVVGQ